MSDKTVSILDVRIDAITKDVALNKILGFLKDGRQHIITTPNPEFLVKSNHNKKFKQLLNNADLNLPDGVGLKWAAFIAHEPLPKNYFMRIYTIYFRFIFGEIALLLFPKMMSRYIPEQISGTDMVEEITKVTGESGHSIFLLGALGDIGEKCRKTLEKKYPKAKIVGTYGGSSYEDGDNKAREKINKVNPDILFVAFGAPKQEFWIKRNLPHLPSVKVAMGVGGAFDYISGLVKRASKLWRRLGLEWLYRLYQQPWRAKRIFAATWTFPNMVVKWKILNK